MKKLLSIIAVLVFALALTACGSKENDNTGKPGSGTENSSKTDNGSGTSGKKDESTSNNTSNDSNQNNSDTGSKDDTRDSSGDRSDMEKKVASYLSKIGGPETISICDGSKISYEPWSEWSMYGDQWTISGAKITAEELKASLDKQLIDGYGFQRDVNLFGSVYYKRAGSKELGLIVSADESTVTVWMTHSPECYSQDYIAAQEASMPKIIPATNALELLPENFYVEVDYGFMMKSYGRKDGSYIFGCKYPENEGWAYAYIKNSDGTYDKYHSEGFTSDKFREEGNVTEEAIQETLSNEFDFEGWSDNGSLSTWGQMSKDFQEGKSFMGANSMFSISQSMEKTGTENIAGVECDVCKDNGMWAQNTFAYDPNTGVMFKIVKTESNEDKVLMVVTKYDAAPTTLGNYKE